MRVVVVTHSGPRVGLGHLRRCLTLGHALRHRNAETTFVLGPDPDGLATARTRGFTVQALGNHGRADIVAAIAAFRDVGVIVADSYDLTADDFRALRALAPLVVIDDIADRQLPADAIWNGGIQGESMDYASRTDKGTRLLLGPRYALLASEYRGLPARVVCDEVSRVLVTVGGADPVGAMSMLYRAVRRALPAVEVDIALGPYVAPPEDALVSGPLVTLHKAPPTLFPLIQRADLAVTAGGQTTYELAASGTPAVVVYNADNQRPQVLEFERRGTLRCGGDVRLGATTADAVARAIRELAHDARERRTMAGNGAACLDGEGAARTAAAVLELC